VIANGGALADTITVSGEGSSAVLTGLAAQVFVTGAETQNMLVVNGAGGNDLLDASAYVAGTIRPVLDGGSGEDTLIGSSLADVLQGGEGNDSVSGGAGADTALLGAGNDTIFWTHGSGNDTVEGQEGDDRLQFAGADLSENISLVANGPPYLAGARPGRGHAGHQRRRAFRHRVRWRRRHRGRRRPHRHRRRRRARRSRRGWPSR
jgi:Ca2+-binding RTX toxin-like protein